MPEKNITKTWFSDKWHYIGVKENTTLYVHLGFAISGYFTGNDYLEINQLVQELCGIIGTEIQ